MYLINKLDTNYLNEINFLQKSLPALGHLSAEFLHTDPYLLNIGLMAKWETHKFYRIRISLLTEELSSEKRIKQKKVDEVVKKKYKKIAIVY